ncbi:MAG: hypothetical protein ACFB15_10325 [Cyclobacteriaceae bacterium]
MPYRCVGLGGPARKFSAHGMTGGCKPCGEKLEKPRFELSAPRRFDFSLAVVALHAGRDSFLCIKSARPGRGLPDKEMNEGSTLMRD